MMELTQKNLEEEIDCLNAQKTANDFSSKMEGHAQGQAAKVRIRRLHGELRAIEDKTELLKSKSKEELADLMRRYEQVRKDYESKMAAKQALLGRSARIEGSKTELGLLLGSLQDEIDVLNQRLQMSEFELRKAERRIRHDQDFSGPAKPQNKLFGRAIPINVSES